MKKYEEMSDHELLMELVRDKKLRDRMRIVKIVFWAAVLIALAVLAYRYIPPVIATVQKWSTILEETEKTLQRVNDFSNSISEEAIQSIKNTVEKIAQFLQRLGF